ncbi:MAG: hypothetical protein P8H59_00445 [Flavobacteriales bacterium]|nr:hypothetical protein [Flavobacteriales bacterium]
MINSLKDNFKSYFGQGYDKIKDGFSKLNKPSDEEENKTFTFFERVIEGLPAFERIGYRTTSFQIEISIPPALEIHFNRFKIATEEEIEELREELKDKRVSTMILNALIKSSTIQESMSTPSFVFSDIEIEVTIPPSIGLRYINRKLVKDEPDTKGLSVLPSSPTTLTN